MNKLRELASNLERRGFQTAVFETAAEAVIYLKEKTAGHTVGFGGSMTLQQLDLRNELTAAGATCLWHWTDGGLSVDAHLADLYLTSVNAVAMTGELVNIDGHGNRVGSTVYGPKEIVFVVGRNKIAEDLGDAIDRARNIAAPLNAKRLKKKTPCAQDGRCHDCQSPECICSVIAIHRRKPSSMDGTVVLINEDLGY